VEDEELDAVQIESTSYHRTNAADCAEFFIVELDPVIARPKGGPSSDMQGYEG
jgi:hypothetical protein